MVKFLYLQVFRTFLPLFIDGAPCNDNKWDVVTHGNVTGTERDLVIAFVDNNFGNLEVMSRARKRLIVVTRYF